MQRAVAQSRHLLATRQCQGELGQMYWQAGSRSVSTGCQACIVRTWVEVLHPRCGPQPTASASLAQGKVPPVLTALKLSFSLRGAFVLSLAEAGKNTA